MKATLTETSLKRLLNYLILTGATCNVFVGVSALLIQDYFLLSICLLLACCTCVGYIMSITGRSILGVHVILGTYIVVFTMVSFTALAAYPLMLVFPMIIGLINLFHKERGVKAIYVVACLVGCVVCIVNSHLLHNGVFDFHHAFNSILIGTGLIFAFLIITELHGVISSKVQNELFEKRKNILNKNKELRNYIKFNMQLENFAYLASHELKTPISNISNFSQLLEKKLKGKLDHKEKELFEMVKMEAWRMNNMMNDLLKLSQLSKREMEFSDVSGDRFVNKLLDRQMKEDLDNISIHNFPKDLFVAETQLNLLFDNLIDNAFKFRSIDKEVRIDIGCKETNGEYIFSVQDNGIGIADNYKERVFLIFKKLDGIQQFKGSGVGLSMCKEIVDRHNGQMWIEDNPEGGTIINFTISKRLNDEGSDIRDSSNVKLEVVA